MRAVCNLCKKQDSERTGPVFSSPSVIRHLSCGGAFLSAWRHKQLRNSGFCLLRCGGSAPSHAGKAGRYAPVPRGFGLCFTFPLRPLCFFVPGSLFFRHFPSAALFPSVFALPISPLCFRRPCTFSLPARFSCVCPCSPGKMPSYIAGARDALYPCFFRRIV